MVPPDVNESLSQSPNFECYSPLIHGKFLNGDLRNRNFRFCWTLDDMVQRITEFHDQKN